MDHDKDMEMQIMEKGNHRFPTSFHAASTFSVVALVPLLLLAFITDYNIMLILWLWLVATLALTVFGLVGAV